MDFFYRKTGQVMYDGTRIGWDRWELTLFIMEITNVLGLSSLDAPTRVSDQSLPLLLVTRLEKLLVTTFQLLWYEETPIFIFR